MFRLPINLFVLLNIFVICIFFISCGFIDLRPVKYSIEPDKLNSILNDDDTPLVIKFDTEMNKKEVENIFKVSSDLEAANGDFKWQGNSLYFHPVAKWMPGIRYNFSLIGAVRAADGRELNLNHYSSFYAISKMALPLLESYYPANGQSVGTNNFYLELQFSSSMDRLSVESALNIESVGNKNYEWQNDDKKLIVTTDKQLVPHASYRWSLRDSAKNNCGLPLLKQYSGSFITDIDKVLPQVTNVYPAVFFNNTWIATGKEIETGLELGNGIAVEFNKPMDENILKSLRFLPSLSGRAEFFDENKIIYFITKNPEPETAYTLIISSDAKDTEGLKLNNEYQISFMPSIPYLEVCSFNDGDNIIDNVFSGMVLPVRINPENKIAVFSLGFSFPFDTEEKQNNAYKITLAPFFPKTNRALGLIYVKWTLDDRLHMEWEGLEAGIGEKNYYLLTIPGGKNGISAGGFYMKEDINIYLEAAGEN